MEASFHSASDDDDGPIRLHGTAFHSTSGRTNGLIQQNSQEMKRNINSKLSIYSTSIFIHSELFFIYFCFFSSFFSEFTRLVVSAFDPLCKYLI